MKLKGAVEVEERGVVAVRDYKTRVSEQYRTVCEKTGEFFREVVKFGALLNEVESFIGNDAKRDGSGLKGWLEENCPDVNYNTAVGYKLMASKCAKMIGGGTQAIACLQGREEVIEPASQEVVTIDAQFIEKRDALFEQVESRRQLEQMWFDFCGKGAKKAGRPAGSKNFEFKKDPPEVESARIWAELKNNLECATLRDSVAFLEPRIAGIMVGVLKDLEKLLTKRANH